MKRKFPSAGIAASLAKLANASKPVEGKPVEPTKAVVEPVVAVEPQVVEKSEVEKYYDHVKVIEKKVDKKAEQYKLISDANLSPSDKVRLYNMIENQSLPDESIIRHIELAKGANIMTAKKVEMIPLSDVGTGISVGVGKFPETHVIIESPIGKQEAITKSADMVSDMMTAMSGQAILDKAQGLTDDVITGLPDEIEKVIALEQQVIELYAMSTRNPARKKLKSDLQNEIYQLMPKFKNVPDLLDFQRLILPRTFRMMKHRQSAILIGATGSGKTYVMGYTLKVLRKYFKQILPPDRQAFIVTKPTIVEQTTRVVLDDFRNRDVFITAYAQIANSNFGDMFVEWHTEIASNNQPTLVPHWHPELRPAVFYCDECQGLKNADSTQSKVMQAVAEPIMDSSGKVILEPPFIMDLSATPYSRPIHVQSVITHVKPTVKSPYGKIRITRDNFMQWAKSICEPYDVTPEMWSADTMREIQKKLEPYTIRFDKIQYKKRTLITQDVIPFKTVEERHEYDMAMEEYNKKRQEIEMKPELFGPAAKLVALMQLQKKAEMLKVPYCVEDAIAGIKAGKNVILAWKYRESLDVCKILLNEAGIDNVSEVKGGQSKQNRQRNIDDFQCEKSNVILLMFSAGGAGLSLHQYDPFNKRPRLIILPPVWNAEELVQILGRGHRVNSCSTTHQKIKWFKDTVEEKVADRVREKCSALKEVVGKKEDWTKFFVGEEIGGKIKTEQDLEESDADDGDDDEGLRVEVDLPIALTEEEAEQEVEETDDEEQLALATSMVDEAG
jgi:hypothetical protein